MVSHRHVASLALEFYRSDATKPRNLRWLASLVDALANTYALPPEEREAAHEVARAGLRPHEFNKEE